MMQFPSKAFAVLCSLLGLIVLPSRDVAQDLMTVSGIVVDASSDRPLPAATVRVDGPSNKGTICNDAGKFQISLPSGKYNLIVSFLGYRSDTLRVSEDAFRGLRCALQPEAIRMPEVIVTDEDPAVEIIRRAIESKPKWLGALKTFQCEAYSRLTMNLDTSIAAITESYLTLYWRTNDSLREVVHQRRQTRNLAMGEIVDRIGQVTNFNDDTIPIGGYKFVGPTAPDAFSFYTYRLLRTRSMDGMDVYDIEVTPKTRIRPLFRGTISIAERSYAVIAVDFEPNEAYAIPFLRNISFHYLQQFRLYENRFWMPADYRVHGKADVSLAGFSLLKFSFAKYVVMSDYRINPGFPDSVLKLPRLTVAPGAAVFDSTYWAQHPLLPLDSAEQEAYKSLDSNATLEKQMRERTKSLQRIGAGLTGLSYADLRFNRVEGLFLGGKFDVDTVTKSLAARGGLGYSFSDRRWKYSAGATVYVDSGRVLGVGGDYYRRLDNRPDEGYYDDLQIFIGSLFSKDDYRDYFLSRGWHGFLEGNFLRNYGAPGLQTRIGYTDERETSLRNITEFSLLDRDRTYRLNPPAADGTLRSVTMDAEFGSTSDYLFRNPYFTAHTSLEYSSKSFLKSDFGFARAYGAFKLKFPTIDLNTFFNPTMSITFNGGILTGDRLPQRLFSLESSYLGSAWFGGLRAARVKEFSGDRFYLISVEHNFRRLPFLASGIPYLYNSNLEIIVFGSVAQSWLTPSALAAPPVFNTTHGLYYEGGLSISRILELFRFDVTYRGVAPRGFALTLGIGDIF
ncbi:MAG TPA: DUF5686 family protein [Bacteroidota bacterium]|nr:DUF5686 family protein [Bacteroidota bacterium]